MSLYVELITVTGEHIEAGEVPAYCDMETTFFVDTDQLVNKVKQIQNTPAEYGHGSFAIDQDCVNTMIIFKCFYIMLSL